ncbi:MAG: hypothetical protein BWX50_01264 [Euryarchaeota archaeon ADurb.Bin009]|nr:MAG: hypothetical protein BWX50_01264 [Euryarchaeota archaeon ADurb.Bin009]
MAFAAERPRRLAATMNVVVSKGVGARSVFCPSLTSVTVRGSFVPASAARAASWSVNRPAVCRASTGTPSFSVRSESIQ